jgi:glycosyltransferase involved in cell wall biosynthesis
LNADDDVLLTVAALESRKGVQHVLKALPGLLQRHPRLKYLVLGDGPYREELETQLDQLGLREVVRFEGSKANVLPYYQAADVFALLSYGEAAPIAPLEAMAVELPLVVARQKPFDEIVTDECAVMVTEEEPESVADAVSGFLGDRAWREGAGAAGRRRVCQEFTWEQIARRYVECSC